MEPYGYSPMNAFFQGIRSGTELDDAAERRRINALALSERQRLRDQEIAERQGLMDFGQGTNLAGFENDPEATRPDWLKQLYRTNPTQALQLEQQVADPYRADREAIKAGKIEGAKYGARTKIEMDQMPHVLALMEGSQIPPGTTSPSTIPATGQPVNNAFAQSGGPLSMGMVTENGMRDPGVYDPTGQGRDINAFSGSGLEGLRGDTTEMKYVPGHGYEFTKKPMSALDKQLKINESRQKGREVELKGQKTGDELRVTAENSRRQADEAVAAIQREITDIQKAMTGTGIRPQDGIARINELRASLKNAVARRDSVYLGKDAPVQAETAQLTPEEKAMAKAGPGTRAKPATATAQPAAEAAPELGAGLPYQQQVELKSQKAKDDVTQTRKVIDESNAIATSALQSKPAADRIFDLLSKEDLGSRVLKLPGGETAATIFSSKYDELNKWRNSLILSEKSEGESQLYNTLPELKIHSASLPAVDNDENVNRRAIVPVKNILEARLLAPQFLQNWAHTHGGSLEGAREMFRGWMQHSPMYRTDEKNGAVSINQNMHYLPLESWVKLRQQYKEPDLVKKLKSGEIEVINGRVFVNK